MATYRPSFVDVSGLTSGISRGLEIAAQQKRQEDQLAEARVDDFLKTYQPGKLRSMDIPDFTGAYNNYKQAALTYSKINRGGGKAEDLSASKAMMDRAQSELNSVYQNSAMAANKHAEYVDYFKNARSKGYEIPNEVSQYINGLSSSRISDLKVEDIPSAYSFDLVPKEIDWDGISKTLDMSDARVKDINTERKEVPWSKDVRGNILYADQVEKFVGRDPVSTVDMLVRLGKSNPKVFNTAKQEYNDLMTGIQNNDSRSIQKMEEIREYFPRVNKPSDVLPEMVFGLSFYRKKSQGTAIDKSSAEQQYKLAGDLAKLQLQAAKINKKNEIPSGADYHPSTIINSVIKNIEIPVSEAQKAGKAGLGYADVSDSFAGFEIKDEENQPVPVKKTYYVQGYGNIEPFFRIELSNGQQQDLKPSEFSRRIVSTMGDINFKAGAEPIISAPKPTTKTSPKPSGKKDPLNLGFK
jgi:hypothetical protein